METSAAVDSGQELEELWLLPKGEPEKAIKLQQQQESSSSPLTTSKTSLSLP